MFDWVVSGAASAGVRVFKRDPNRRVLEQAVDRALRTVLEHVDAEVREDVRRELARCFTGAKPPTVGEWGTGTAGLRAALLERLAGLKHLEHADSGAGFAEMAGVDIEALADQLTNALEKAVREVAAARGVQAYVDNANFLTLLNRLDALDAKLGSPQTALVVAMEDLPCPSGLVSLPRRPGLFLGRDEDLRAVGETLDSADAVVVTAVHGLGGVGKSALALQYATDHQDHYAPVWWITTDQVGITQGLADLALALQPGLRGSAPLEDLAQAALRWLRSHTGWLLVLDNVDEPAEIAAALAGVRQGRVLITSRRATGWHDIATPHPLDVLNPGPAEDLLIRIVTHDTLQADLTGVSDLSEELGGLPLAIKQAGAYIAQTRVTPAAYLDGLRATPDLYQHTTDDADPEGQRTVARIWNHTMNHLRRRDPLTSTVLGVLSWYAPERIPTSLLANLAEPTAVQEALGLLRAYSMITHHGTTLSVHRLVQAITRTTAEPGTLHNATRALVDSLNEDLGVPSNWHGYKTLLPHAEALLACTATDHTTTATAVLHDLIGMYLGQHGSVTHAIDHLLSANQMSHQLLGPDHPYTLATRHGLASAHQWAGQLDQAITLLQAVLTDSERILGPEHLVTLTVRHSLAFTYRSAGQLDQAITLLQAVLTDSERILGPEHPTTLATRHSLASTYWSAGQLDQAVTLLQAVLTDSERILGPEHPTTLATRHGLATAHQSAGQLDQAITLLQAVLTDSERILGPEHPNTLTARQNLAFTYRSAGQLDQAITQLQAVLTDSERILGPEHPTTLAARHNLAFTHMSAGQPDKAITQLQAVLTDRERILGPNHPDTTLTRACLASTRKK